MPSVVLYDQQGNAQAFGAETEDEEVLDEAETNEWKKAAWLLCLSYMYNHTIDLMI